MVSKWFDWKNGFWHRTSVSVSTQRLHKFNLENVSRTFCFEIMYCNNLEYPSISQMHFVTKLKSLPLGLIAMSLIDW